jgi:glycerol-3-phosphate acyltransferase PlsX
MLQASGLNFIGNVEAKELYAAAADVIVTDGFVGNVFLKTSEAVASFLSNLIKQEITSSPISSLGGLLARPAFRRVNAVLDPAKYGAAPLLGVDGLVFIGHGRFGAEGVLSGIRAARQAVERDLMTGLRDAIQTRLAAEPPQDRT